MKSFTFFRMYRTWTSQPRVPVCCPTSPEQHRQHCPHPDLGHWGQEWCCADQEGAAAATWLYLQTSHVDTFGWCKSDLHYFAGCQTHCCRSPTSVFVNGWKLVRMGQQTVPVSTCILVQTALSPVKSGVQWTLPQGTSICPIHCYEKHTWRW